ncbi:MAG: sigma-70 family RNA polymerase sigma factor [Verrucomicrobiota bacterium]
MGEVIITALRTLLSGGDEELMMRVKATGDSRAFASLVSRWEEPIRRLCTRMTGDPYRGDDLKQETFARLFSKRATYLPTGKFSTYLWRIALNICHDELRRVNRRRELFPQADADEGESVMAEFAADDPAPDARVAQAEEGEMVRQALMRLPEMYRSVLVLRHYERLKLSEIAETLEIPLGTVNSRMAEALARLTRLLEPQFDQPQRPRESNRRELLVL